MSVWHTYHMLTSTYLPAGARGGTRGLPAPNKEENTQHIRVVLTSFPIDKPKEATILYFHKLSYDIQTVGLLVITCGAKEAPTRRGKGRI